MNARLIVCMLIAVHLVAVVSVSAEEKLPPIKPIERLLPPKGIDIGKAERDKLEARLATLTKAIAEAKLDAQLRPDVEIFTKAVRWALDFDEFYDAKKDIAKAHAALDSAQQRLDEMRSGKPGWVTQRGLLARGYRSDIDDSVQPYGLHIPDNLDLTKPVPLLVWLHGRGDKETDLHFIAAREKSKGEFAPDWCITLHPYGRGTIGFKFAGEIDVLDAIESVKKRYKIDEDRIALAGFSMGGAGAWHIGAHYADKFCVVHAGAGFVETAKYNKLTPDKYPAWYEQKLWGWYDVPCYTRNLFNVPVIAYSGENDKQKQAADLMAEAFKAEGRELRHIIGPGVEHKYEAKAKEQVLKEIKAAVEKGRDRYPKKVSMQTNARRYSRHYWLEACIVEDEFLDVRIDAEFDGKNRFTFDTKNVICLRAYPPTKDFFERNPKLEIIVNGGRKVTWESRMFQTTGCIEILVLDGTAWDESRWEGRIERKKSTLQGPIDDAFLSKFLVVTPTGQSPNRAVQRWTDAEYARFRERWRALFRGDPLIKRDTDVTKEDMSTMNLVLWGDAHSNIVLKRLGAELPVRFEDRALIIGTSSFEASAHVPICIATNELNNHKTYIVLNSGPTFREGHDRTNSQQTPKLPDWAIIGLDKDPDAFSPGTIKAAGFFDENWKVKKDEK